MSMPNSGGRRVVDSVTLRFDGETGDGVALHELRAAHVAEVLQGLVGLTSDFDKAGVFHEDGPAGSEILVRPAQPGSFLLEVVRVVTDNWEVAGLVGAPSVSQVIWWATKSMRADVKDFDHLDNGNVKVTWQDDTAEEVPAAAWDELQKRRRRRKKQLRQIMAPLSDPHVAKIDVAESPDDSAIDEHETSEPDEVFTLVRSDYDAVRPEDDVTETDEEFEIEARMSAIDFDDPTRWRVKTKSRTRNVTVEDDEFLARVARGLAIRPQDIFWLRIREDATKKNGRTRTTWTVLSVENHRRAVGDDEPKDTFPPTP